MIVAMTRRKLFRITEELMHAANEAILPTYSDAEVLADQFAIFLMIRWQKSAKSSQSHQKWRKKIP